MHSLRRRGMVLGSLGLALVLSGSDSTAVAQSTVRDIDGNVYPVVTIGDQGWMAMNLAVTRAPSGTEIKSFFFNDDSLSFAGRGRLYTWDVAMSGSSEPGAQGICPDGWHLPTDADWTHLFDYVEGRGIELMAGGSTGFDASLDGGADYRGNYLYRGEYALYWSSTEVSEERAYHHSISAEGQLDKFAAMKGARIYVRCVED